MNTIAKTPTFEEILVDALTDHTISSNALYDLVEQTQLAIVTADNDANIAKAAALDPLKSPDPVAARATMEDAQFRAARLRSVLPRLKSRMTDVANHEEYLRWHARYSPLKPKVEAAAAKLATLYQNFVAEAVPLFAEIEKLDGEVSAVSQAKPYHAKASNGDGCHLRSVELTARGFDGFGTSFGFGTGHKIMDIKLPVWDHQDQLAWPPNRQIDWSNVVPVSSKPHPGADWAKVQQEEHAEKAAIAERLRAEEQRAEGIARANYNRRGDSVTY